MPLIPVSSLSIDATDDQVVTIVTWAEPIPAIVEVWLFGSRAKRTARPDSDFDIGIVLAAPYDDGTNWALGAYFSTLGRDWRLALQAELRLHVSLEAIGSGAELEAAASSRCVLLWRREILP